MSYAILLLALRRAAMRVSEDVEARRVPLKADLKVLGLKSHQFVRRMG